MKPAPPRPPWGLWVFLTFLVWGAFAADRGLYQDDVSVLSLAKEGLDKDGPAGLLNPMGTATRRLLSLAFLPGVIGPEPVLALQLAYGILWLGIGWAAYRLTAEIEPASPRAALLAGTLTLCATSDYLTDSLVALGYQASVFSGVLAIALVLRFLRSGRWTWLVSGCALAAASVFTIDGATLALALAPALFLAIGGLTRRTAAAFASWGAALLPYAVLFLSALRARDGYAAVAMAPLTVPMRLERTAVLLANDLLPWMWTFGRREFGPRPPHAIPPWLWAAAGAAAAIAVLLWIRRVPPRASEAPSSAGWSALALSALWLAALAVATHAAWAGIAFQHLFYRTHVLSRVAVSALLAIALDRLLAGGRRARAAAVAGIAVFTGFGAAGGMERQDLYLATWRDHRAELASLVEEVPGARPWTTVLLVVPHDPAYQATEAPYLAARWFTLLYEDRSRRPDVFLWSADAHTECVPEADGFRCRLFEETGCFAAGTCGLKLRWRRIVVLTWRAEEGRFRLEDEIPDVLLGAVPPPLGLYRPRALVLPGPPDPHAAAFLHGDIGLARLLR